MPEHGEPQPGDPTISLDETRATATANAQRVAEIGSWPDHIEPEELLERIPKKGETAPGFDASVACSLNLIPEDKQRLSAVLHADYTKETVEQIRKELEDQSPDSETNWWLSASSLCLDEEVDTSGFLDQVEKFRELAANPDKRLQAAREEHEKMRASYHIEDGIPYGERDGCIQAAYIDGYPFGVYHSQKYGLYFVGTYEDSLGLEDFQWSDEKDEKGRPKSGPVHGSKQFVKCASEEELQEVLKNIKEKLTPETGELPKIRDKFRLLEYYVFYQGKASTSETDMPRNYNHYIQAMDVAAKKLMGIELRKSYNNDPNYSDAENTELRCEAVGWLLLEHYLLSHSPVRNRNNFVRTTEDLKIKAAKRFFAEDR